MIEEIKYYDLPDDFFEKVIFYGITYHIQDSLIFQNI